MRFLLTINKRNTLKNPHFWFILVASLFFIFLYQAWPWRTWQLAGPWQAFGWLSSWQGLAELEFIYHIVGSLFLIPILYGAIVFSWRGALFSWLLAVAGVLPIVTFLWNAELVIMNLFCLLLPFLAATIITMEFQWRAKEKTLYAEREFERQTYIDQLLKTQETERLRIAQEIHDESIQTLMLISNRAEEMVSSSHTIKEAQDMRWIKNSTLQAIEDLRRLSIDLRPQVLDYFGLLPALRWLVNNINAQSNIRTEIKVLGNERKLSPAAEVNIFRFVQEALSNIKRHSQANTASVVLEFFNDYLFIEILDNGCGFQPPERLGSLATKGKLGMIGIEQRILSIGGTFKVISRPGEGTSVLAEIKY